MQRTMKSLERGGQANEWSLLYLGIKKGKTLHIVGAAAFLSIEVQRSPVGLSLHKVVSVQLLLSNHAYRRGEFGNEPFEQLMFDWIQSSSPQSNLVIVFPKARFIMSSVRLTPAAHPRPHDSSWPSCATA